MDNLTHSLVGLAAAKAGLERWSPGTTTLCVLAANAPDSDIISLIGGRWSYLHHHRGITHSIVGTTVLALALPLVFYLGGLLIARVRNRAPTMKLGALLIASIIVSATHPLMDWTNNYGVRLLLPWDSRWFHGDFVFIIDPFLWLILGGAAFLLTSKTKKQLVVWIVIALMPSYLVLFGPGGPTRLANETLIRFLWIIALIVVVTLYRRKIGGRRGARIAIAALATVAIYCAGLAATHAVALRRAKTEASNIASQNAEQIVKVAAMPTAGNPTSWLCVMETDRATYKFQLSLLHDPGASGVVRYGKPEESGAWAVTEALRDKRTGIFLEFARFPVARVVGEDCATQTLVQFADLRYTEPGSSRGTFSLEVPVDCPIEHDKDTDAQH
jgi:inner membrane protein